MKSAQGCSSLTRLYQSSLLLSTPRIPSSRAIALGSRWMQRTFTTRTGAPVKAVSYDFRVFINGEKVRCIWDSIQMPLSYSLPYHLIKGRPLRPKSALPPS